MDESRSRWEQRALESAERPVGVLFQGLPDQANLALHEWHVEVIRAHFLPQLALDARVLDIGCGYGRLARPMLDARGDLTVIGQDFALPYCRSFAEKIGPVVQADLARPPFQEGAFDAVLAVTSLMYVETSRRGEAFAALARLLRRDGVALLLDPGAEMMGFLRRVRGRGAAQTGGGGFSRQEYLDLGAGAGLRVEASGGNPRMSLALLAAGATQTQSRVMGALLRQGLNSDVGGASYSRLALHRWMVVRKI